MLFLYRTEYPANNLQWETKFSATVTSEIPIHRNFVDFDKYNRVVGTRAVYQSSVTSCCFLVSEEHNYSSTSVRNLRVHLCANSKLW